MGSEMCIRDRNMTYDPTPVSNNLIIDWLGVGSLHESAAERRPPACVTGSPDGGTCPPSPGISRVLSSTDSGTRMVHMRAYLGKGYTYSTVWEVESSLYGPIWLDAASTPTTSTKRDCTSEKASSLRVGQRPRTSTDGLSSRPCDDQSPPFTDVVTFGEPIVPRSSASGSQQLDAGEKNCVSVRAARRIPSRDGTSDGRSWCGLQ